jgi:glycine/D-amino acid oxidase-like deaminating enzyme
MTGAITVTASPASADRLAALAQAWRDLGASADWVGADHVRRYVFSERYCGGILFRDAAMLNPVAFCRGLAQVLMRRGVLVHEGAPVEAVVRDADYWRVATRRGDVRARAVLLATNGWSVIDARLARAPLTTLPLAMVATAPLPDRGREVAKDAMAVSDADKRDLFGVGFDPDGRLVYSVLPRFGRPSAAERAATDYQRKLFETFPQLRGRLDWTHVWYASEPIHRDYQPRLYRIDARGLYSLCGYSGYGLSQAIVLAPFAVDVIFDRTAEADLVPIADPPHRRTNPMLRNLVLRMSLPALARSIYG